MSAQQLVAVAGASTDADLLARAKTQFPEFFPGRLEANSMRVDMAARDKADDVRQHGRLRRREGLLICSCCARGRFVKVA